jgi:hypothetical protein
LHGNVLCGPRTLLASTKLSSVCRSWKETCDRNLLAVLGLLNADFDALPNARVIPLHFLADQAQALKARSSLQRTYRYPLLTRLLTECQTDKLTIVKAYLGEKDFSPWISKDTFTCSIFY